MNKIAIWGGATLVASVTVLAGAAWSGASAKRQIEAEIPKLEKVLPLKVTQSTYDKGLFSSTHTFSLVPGCGDDKAAEGFSLTVRQHIKHGPLPGWTSVGRAAVETELVMPAEARAILKDFPEGGALIKGRTLFSLFGGSDTSVSTPKLEFQEAKGKGQLSIHELVLRVRQSAGGKINYEMNWPGLNVVSVGNPSGGNVEIEGLSLRGDTSIDDKNPLWFLAGKGEFDLKSMEINVQPPSGKPLKLAFSKVVGDSTTTFEGGLLSKVSHLKGQGSVNDFQLSKLQFDTSVKRLDATTYALLLQQAASPQALCGADTDPAALMAKAEASMAAMTSMLVHNPEVAVDNLTLEVDGHAGELAYAFGTKGVTAEEAKSPELRTVLFNKAYASGRFEIPMAWLEKAMVDSAPERQAQDRAMLDAMVAQAVDAGYVKREGNFLSSKFSLEKGELKVNEKPMGPAF